LNIKLYIGSELADFNEPFNVVFSIGDIRDLSMGNNNKSYTLNLPLTKTNKRLLSFISQSDVKSEPSATGRLYIGEQLIIQGAVIVLSYDDKKAEVIISSDDWITALATKKMTDLDLSAYDHALTHANVEDSWTASYPFYRYPMINFGFRQLGGTVWLPTDFIPMIQVTGLIAKILEPYTISSSWIASNSIKDVYILAKETQLSDAFLSAKEFEARVTNDSDNQDSYSIAAGATVTRTLTKDPFNLNTEVTDSAGAYSISTDKYTIEEDGTYRFQAKFHLICDINPTRITINSQTVTCRIYQNSTVVAEYTTTSASNVIDVTDVTIDTNYIHCADGDEIKCYLYLSNNMTNVYASPITVDMGALSVTSWFKNVWDNANRCPGLNKNISIEEMLPDISQLDFLSAIKEIYNLRFWFDKSRQVVYIEPWDQFLSSSVVALSSVVSYDNNPSDLISKEYSKKTILKWRDDTSDGAYKEYLKYFTSPGKKEILLTSLYCKKSDTVKESIFSAIASAGSGYDVTSYYGLKSIRNTDYSAELFFNRATNFNTRIVEWKGLTAGFTWEYESETKTDYPRIEILDFDTIYTSYWQKLFHYIDKGKLRTVKIKVTPMFLAQFFTVINTATSEGFRPTYQIDDDYYFLQKITTDGVMAELELILK
jgi:hypothetical protein